MVQVVVAGVGMIPFAKPGKSETYVRMGERAARLALDDAAVAYSGIQQAFAGYVYGDSACGQAALYGLGLTGIPIINVNNNCSTGSSALFLARAIGQTDPRYTDVDRAKQAGHHDLPVPPTFLFSIDLERPDPFRYLTDLGIDLRTVLHGEQEFSYHRMAYAGDDLSTRSRVTDVYEKKGGALQFLVKETTVTDQDGALVATLRGATVIRPRPEAGR